MQLSERAQPYRATIEAAAVAYGLSVATVDLASISENITFRVNTTDGRAYVLRLHRPGYHNFAELDSERTWLDALRDVGVAVPEPLPAPDGRYYLPVAMPDGEPARLAGLSVWAEGDIVDDLLEDDPDNVDVDHYYRQLGRIMATMHTQASGWTPPPGFARHRLDADGFFGEAPFWGRFWEHPELTVAEREVLAAIRGRLHDALTAYGTAPRTFSLIHADLHLNNLLVDDGTLAVIDFDDAGFGWHQYDIAVALFEFGSGLPDPEHTGRVFLEAYRQVRPLSDADAAWIPVFELVRGLALIGWKAQRPEVSWPDGYFDRLKESMVAQAATLELPTH